MNIPFPAFDLLLEQNPFRMTIQRRGKTLLRAAAPGQPAAAIEPAAAGARVDFGGCTLEITPAQDGAASGLEIRVTPPEAVFALAFEMDGWWYGHGEIIHQLWPLNKAMIHASPMHTFDNGPTGLSGILNPAWFSSGGAVIIAHTPLAAGANQPPASAPRYEWSLTAQRGPFAHRPQADPGSQGDGRLTLQAAGLQLSLRFAEDVRGAWTHIPAFFGRPAGAPPDSLFRDPTWTTWARYKTAIHQQVVLDFAAEIVAHDYPFGVMEIDDRWQVFYGDLDFDPARFPEPKQMVDRLHALGFRVTAWVIPFLQPESDAFAEGARHGWLVRGPDGNPALVPWWQGLGGLLDVSHPQALAWFFERLRALQEKSGLDGFKFDAGEACFFPENALTYEPLSPNDYTHRYVEAVAERYRLTEVRSGWRNQRAPIFFRQWDKTTHWGLDNGLHSVLTGILALGASGYPFILPDMIGGNAYEEQASAELMIRWTQLNALLPAMQFSLAPWDFGKECDTLCRQYARLHQQYTPRILALASEAARSGAPLVRPLWWLAPGDEAALTCDDQFLLGDDVLVAPILRPGERSRRVIFPPGLWRDPWTGETIAGGCIRSDHPAPLHQLPYFERAG